MKQSAFLLLAATLLTAQSVQDVEITQEPHHKLVLANDEVRVFDVEIPPHGETLMHWHRHDYLLVMLDAGDVVNTVEGKEPVKVSLADGEVRFMTGNFAHVFRNLAGEPSRNVTIEIVQDATRRLSPAQWNPGHPDEDRGLEVLTGGTKEIMFVKDGVRVSEVDLQPGGVIPMHHHAGPHLAVALADYELRSDVAGKGPQRLKMKRGESEWFPGGYSHAVTNTGKSTAKLITMEFK